jgi:hypothetical protein
MKRMRHPNNSLITNPDQAQLMTRNNALAEATIGL